MLEFEIRIQVKGTGYDTGWVPSYSAYIEDAEQEAYECVCDKYDSMAGCNGLRTVNNIMREDRVSEDEAWEKYVEERELSIVYEARTNEGEE